MLLLALTTIVALVVVLTDFGLRDDAPRRGCVAVSPRTAMCGLHSSARPWRRPQQAHRAARLLAQVPPQEPATQLLLYDHTGPGGARLSEACSI